MCSLTSWRADQRSHPVDLFCCVSVHSLSFRTFLVARTDSCPTALRTFFPGSSLQAPLCECVANSLSVFAGAIASLSIGVVGNCLIGLLIGFALQPARVPSYPVPVSPTRENTPRPVVSVVAGRVSAERQSPLKVSGQRLPRGGISFLFNPDVGFAVGVCTCVTLCCTHRSISRKIIVAAEQLRSLPEGFRLIRQPLRS